MKKKIKDLTNEEVTYICDNHYIKCHKCPLFVSGKEECKDMLLEQYSNEEIEVEENGN